MTSGVRSSGTTTGHPWPERGAACLASVLALLLLVLTVVALPAQAGGVQDLPAAGTAMVKEVLSADTVVLADGRVVRLAGIQGPRLSSSRARGHAWPLAMDAKAALDRLALGQTVTLHAAGLHQDRHDRWVAHLVRTDGLWLEGELLSLGWARVYLSADLKTVGTEMYALEREAREAHRGIWGNRFYAVRAPDGLDHDADSFQIVEGRVVTAALAKGQLFLDFGPNWRTDFSVYVPRRAVKAFRQRHGDLRQLQGQMVRVRGWVFRHNGPEIELTMPELLERLDPPETPPVVGSPESRTAP